MLIYIQTFSNIRKFGEENGSLFDPSLMSLILNLYLLCIM
jgi:hypothetical protein